MTYTFTSIAGGTAKFKSSGGYHIPSTKPEMYENPDSVIFRADTTQYVIYPATDTIIINGTTNAPGSLSVTQLSDALNVLFPKATTTGGGNGSATTDASQLISGTLPDGRLSGNVSLALKPTAIKTTAYTAAAGELVKVDATAANVPITLPTAPPDKARIAVKMIAVSGSNVATIATGGTDVFNKAGGSTSATLTLLNQAVTLQYESAIGVWSVISSDMPLSQLDARFGGTSFLAGTYKSLSEPSLRSITINDARVIREINFGDYFDPESGANCTTLLQSVLDYAYNLSLKLRSAGLKDLQLRSCVRVVLPYGQYRISETIVVPQWVELECRGFLSLWDATGSLTANSYLPLIVFTHNSHCKSLNLQCEVNGKHQNGVVFGYSSNITTATIAAKGSGYSVGDVIKIVESNGITNADTKLPFKGAQVTVTSIDGTGGITGFTLNTTGIYAHRPALQTATMAVTGGTGIGAAFSPVWAGNFISTYNRALYFNAGQTVSTDMTIGKVKVFNCNNGNDAVYGYGFGVRVNCMNTDIDSLEVYGGYRGIIVNGTDIRANFLNAVNSWTGLYVIGSSFTCPNVVLDSCHGSFLQMEHAKSVRLSGRMFFEDANDIFSGVGSGSWDGCGNDGYAVIINRDVTGQASPDIILDFNCVNVGKSTGIPLLYFDYLFTSNIKLNASNKVSNSSFQMVAASKLLSQFAVSGGNNGNTVKIEGQIDGISNPLVTGAFKGTYDIWDGTNLTYYIKGASPILRRIASSTVQVSNTGNTTENTVFTVTIPGNSIGPTGTFQFVFMVSCTNSANSKTIRLKLNGIGIFANSLTTSASFRGIAQISNRNSMTAQIGGSSTGGTGYNYGGSGAGVSTFSIDTSSDMTLTVTLQNALATETISLEDFQVFAI